MRNVLGVSAGNGVILFPFRPYLIGNIECRSDYYVKGKPVQWFLNYPGLPMVKDFDPTYENVEVIIGHPKCGHSSMFALSRGKKFTSHVGEPSLDLYFKAVKHYQPNIFLMENLPKLLDSFPLEELKKLFNNYALMVWRGSVSEFGNSQVSRKRLLIIGLRKDIYCKKYWNILHRIRVEIEPRTTGTLLQNLPQNGHIKEPLSDIITMYAGYKISLAEAKAFWRKHPELRHWPVTKGKMKTAPGVYINRTNDIPLTVRKTNRQFNPEGEQMSPRELARIQGIPDRFFLWDNNGSQSINKGRVTVANTPPMEIAYWFFTRLLHLHLIK